MRRLESVGGLAVSQQKEWGEILTGFEGINKYVVSDERGTELFYALEEQSSASDSSSISSSALPSIFAVAFRPFLL